MEWTTTGLREVGFCGFVPFRDLPTADVPRTPGVYAVVRPASTGPQFLPTSPAGRFKKKDPSVSTEVLRDNWVMGTDVLYIGKAAGGRTERRGLRQRLGEYRRFGNGDPVGHWGGRYIWQLADSSDLLVCWRMTPEEPPERVESAMLSDFITRHGRRPFANLTGGGSR